MSSIPRFFVPPESLTGDTAVLPSEAAHHARNVLRLRPGETIVLHDGEGFAYRAVLEEVSPKSVTVCVVERVPVITEPKTRITVAQALPKTGEKVEQVLQHGTEIGAAGFILFPGRRSVARLEEKGEKIERRLLRWQGIAQGAAEQSGRGMVPDVAWCGASREVARSFTNYDRTLVLHESATLSLATALKHLPARATRLLVLVGPEGGFDSKEEITLFAQAGGLPVSLGPRVLRTETAALVALAQILFAREPWSPDADTPV